MRRSLVTRRSWLLVVLLASSWRANVQAQATASGRSSYSLTADRTEEAKALFAAGRAAFEAGLYVDALASFERSYAISHRPGLLFNIALSHDRLRQDEKALAAYEAYLAAVPAAENRAEIETRAAAIRAALSARRPATVAPTPAQAAATMAPSTEPATTAPDASAAEAEADSGVLGKWWFWAGVAAVVAGGVTVGVVAASGGSDSATPLAPKSGVIVTTLGVAR